MRCWYHHWQMSNALERRELASYLARGHVARCAACRAFGQSLAVLDARLARDAHLAATPVVVARRARWPLWLAGAATAGAAAAALALGAGDRPVIAPAEPAPALRVSDALVRVRGVADSVSQVLARTPLDTELDDLIHDGKRGLDAVLDAGGLR